MKLIEEGFFKRNKKLILIASIIMLVSAVVGAGAAFMNADGQYNTISTMIKGNASSDVTLDDLTGDALMLFTHNLTADLFTVIGGFFFSIISVVLVIFNGLSIGGMFGIDLPFACVAILPHAIIEYFASALALAIAFKITLMEIEFIKNRDLLGTIRQHKTEIKDIIVILIVMIVLLVIAAVIGDYITPRIAIWYFGL